MIGEIPLLLCRLAEIDGVQQVGIAAAGQARLNDPATIVRSADEHGLLGLLDQALGSAAERQLGREAYLGLRSLAALRAARCRAQQAALDEILEAFDRRGVPVCLLKGAALSRLVYERPEHRPMGDLDLLVPPERVEPARRLLEELGFNAPAPSWRQRLLSHQLPAAARGRREDRVVVELHVDALSYLSPGSMVLGRGVGIEPYETTPRAHGPAGGVVPTLEPTEMLIQLVAHAINVRQPFTLIHLADMARWIDRLGERIEWRQLRRSHPATLRRLAWLAQLVPMPTDQLPPMGDPGPTLGLAYRGWSRHGLRPSRRDGSLYQLVHGSIAPPEWWLRSHYAARRRTPTWWIRGIRHPLHLVRVGAARLLEG